LLNELKIYITLAGGILIPELISFSSAITWSRELNPADDHGPADPGDRVHSPKGILHRDVKPDAALTGRGRQQIMFFVVDFELSKRLRRPDSFQRP
jgi:hypothetical protein